MQKYTYPLFTHLFTFFYQIHQNGRQHPFELVLPTQTELLCITFAATLKLMGITRGNVTIVTSISFSRLWHLTPTPTLTQQLLDI
jgi:hypothetical protein